MAVYRADVEGFAYTEIARITGSPTGTVMSRLRRGRHRLRDLLEEHARKHGRGLRNVAGLENLAGCWGRSSALPDTRRIEPPSR